MNNLNKTDIPAVASQDPMAIFAFGDASGFVADGPLAAAYGQALDQLYSKEVDADTGIVLESQTTALESQEIVAEIKDEEVTTWLNWKDRPLEFANDGDDTGMLYGVKREQASVKDLNRVVNAVSKMTDGQKAASVVVLDGGTGTAATPDSVKQGTELMDTPVVAAMEAYCRENGVMVYRSFHEFVKRHGG